MSEIDNFSLTTAASAAFLWRDGLNMKRTFSLHFLPFSKISQKCLGLRLRWGKGGFSLQLFTEIHGRASVSVVPFSINKTSFSSYGVVVLTLLRGREEEEGTKDDSSDGQLISRDGGKDKQLA